MNPFSPRPAHGAPTDEPIEEDSHPREEEEGEEPRKARAGAPSLHDHRNPHGGGLEDNNREDEGP